MKWTTDKPTEPGFYWLENQRTGLEAQVVRVTLEYPRRKVYWWQALTNAKSDVYNPTRNQADDLWYGPLEAPEDDDDYDHDIDHDV